MARHYKFATHKEQKFIQEAIEDFWKPKDIAKKIGWNVAKVRSVYRRLGYRIVKGNGRFKKGSVPHNKGCKGVCWSPGTTFKKGNSPKNTLPIGSKRVDKDGIIQIKYDNHKWRSLHSHLWIEKYGNIPGDSIVIFKEGVNKNIFTVQDLLLVTRAELVKLNSRKRWKTT